MENKNLLKKERIILEIAIKNLRKADAEGIVHKSLILEADLAQHAIEPDTGKPEATKLVKYALQIDEVESWATQIKSMIEGRQEGKERRLFAEIGDSTWYRLKNLKRRF